MLFIKVIDDIFLKHDWPGSNVEYINDGQIRYLAYRLNYTQETEVGYPVQTNVHIVHRYDVLLRHDAYQVHIGWRVDRDDANEAFYETIYSLEQYPGVIHSTVEEFNLSTELLKVNGPPEHTSRPMTRYDHNVLYKRLADINKAHDTLIEIETAEPS